MKFYGHNGILVQPDELEHEEDYLEAVSEDDKITHLTSHVRVRIGAAGTGEGTTSGEMWDWEHQEQAPEGFCKLIRELPALVEKVGDEREAAGRCHKQFRKDYQLLGAQLFWDDELRDEILEEGAENWLRRQK
jgi:hypothetical protein